MARRTVFAILAVWVFIFAFETLFHGVALGAFYASLSGFRSDVESVELLPLLIAGHLVLAVGIVGTICHLTKASTVAAAAAIGAFLALTFGGGSAILQYVAQPLPLPLVFAWIVGGIAEFAAAGAVARLVFGQPEPAHANA